MELSYLVRWLEQVRLFRVSQLGASAIVYLRRA